MKKHFIYTFLMLISAIIMHNVLPERGLSGLICGVNIKNNISLMSSEVLFYSLVIFNNFGQWEKYLNGFGKYCLLRYKKREIIFIKLIVKTAIKIFLLNFLRVVVYFLVLLIDNENILDCLIQDLIHYFTISLLVLLLLSIIQMIIELKLSSFSGLIVTFSYIIISTILGGYFIENQIYLPIIFLTTNFSMKSRTDIICDDFIGFSYIYSFLILYILASIFICNKIIKHRDIF